MKYKVVREEKTHKAEETCNKMGAEGWRLVSTNVVEVANNNMFDPDYYIYLFFSKEETR